MDILEWHEEKILGIENFNDPQSVEGMLDAYALDENGLRMHAFHSRLD